MDFFDKIMNTIFNIGKIIALLVALYFVLIALNNYLKYIN